MLTIVAAVVWAAFVLGAIPTVGVPALHRWHHQRALAHIAAMERELGLVPWPPGREVWPTVAIQPPPPPNVPLQSAADQKRSEAMHRREVRRQLKADAKHTDGGGRRQQGNGRFF